MEMWCLLLLVAAAFGQDCDRTKCKGPIKFYEDLNCKPVYENPGDCCALKYDCSHLKDRSADKCYANGHEYEVGDKIREEDCFNPCDKQCVCYQGDDQVAIFSCPLYNCYRKEAEEGCYLRRKLDSCCGSEQVCLANPEDRFKCEVDGKIYMDGERFYPSEKPNSLCQCAEGYDGKNVAPFCRKSSCGLEYKHPREIRENCAPIMHEPNPVVNPCIFSFRCQNENDTVIGSNVLDAFDEDKLCKFGDLKLRIGDELSKSTDPLLSSVECTCEVPPTMTCRQLSDDECSKKSYINLN